MDPEVTRCWYEWQRTKVPVERFRSGNRTAASYDVECELDHIRSYVAGLGASFLEGRVLDYSRLSTEELQKLAQVERDLRERKLPADLVASFRAFIDATDRLLRSIAKAA